VLRQGALGAVLGLGLFAALGPIEAAIRRDPAVTRLAEVQKAERAYNAFIDSGRAPMREFDAILEALNDELRRLQADRPEAVADHLQSIQALAARSTANEKALRAIETTDPDLAQGRDELIGAQAEMSKAFASLDRALARNSRDDLTGPDGFTARRDKALTLAEAFANRLKRFQAEHSE
jgi:hypothetical protein